MKNKKILITGGCGLIGTGLVKALHEDNEIFVYDNLFNSYLLNTKYSEHENVSIHNADIMDSLELIKQFKIFKPDVVIHAAAIIGIDNVAKNPLDTIIVNTVGTYNVLEAVRRTHLDIELFVNFSTSEVSGKISYLLNEKEASIIGTCDEPRWAYAAAKLTSEHLAKAYYTDANIPTVTIRPFNVYGPGQFNEGAMMKFVTRALKGQNLVIDGNGNQIRSWCYIDDFVEGIIAIMENKEKTVGKVFNLGNPSQVCTITQLAESVKQILDSASNIIYSGRDIPDINLRIPAITLVKELTKWNPTTTIKQGIQKYVGELNSTT